MKNRLIFLSLTTLIAFTSCQSDKATGEDKNLRLAELKKQQTTLNAEIAALEKELNLVDTTKRVKTFFVEVTEAKPTGFSHFIELQGAVIADDEHFLTAKVPGAVTRANIKVGDRVAAGQVIGEIDDELIRTQIDEIKKRWELADAVFQKQEALWKQNIGSELQYLSAKNNKEALEKGMATVEKSRDLYRIVAPISGVVDEANLHQGMVVAPGVPLAKIVNFSKLKFKTDVPESYAGKVRQGNPVVISFPDLGKDLAGKLSYIGASVNPLNRTFKVEVPLKGNEPGVLPNMAGILKVADYTNPNAFNIPINILKKDMDGRDFVLLETNGQATKAYIKVGQYYQDKAEVLSGLKSGDKLITTGFEDLSEGDVLQVN